ncbi:MAG: acyclic terpene utilization AtuA family protein, partial [Nocardioides sp.]
MTTLRDQITIANCGGFWGDDPTAARRQVEGGPVDYLVMDYLAEITMAILQKQRAKDPSAG